MIAFFPPAEKGEGRRSPAGGRPGGGFTITYLKYVKICFTCRACSGARRGSSRTRRWRNVSVRRDGPPAVRRRTIWTHGQRDHAAGGAALPPQRKAGRTAGASRHGGITKKGHGISVTLACGLVPRAGLEPAQLLPLPPQDSVSTSSTTSAAKRIFTFFPRGWQVFFQGFSCFRRAFSALARALREPCLTGACFSGVSSGSSAAARCPRPCRREIPGKGTAFHPLRRRAGRKSSVRPGS